MPYYDVGCYECGTRMSVFLLPFLGFSFGRVSLVASNTGATT